MSGTDDGAATVLVPPPAATAEGAASLGGAGSGAVSLGASGTVPPLNAQEAADTRRFCGYGVVASESYMATYTAANSAQVDAVLAALSPQDTYTLRTVYLANLYVLEAAIPAMSSTLIVDSAAVFKRNANEQPERNELFDYWRRRLAWFLGVPIGAGIVPYVPAVLVV